MAFVARNLDKSKLPTNRDVMEYLLFLRNESIRQGATRTTGFDDFETQAIGEIEALWQRARIPTIMKASIRSKIRRLIVEKYRGITKNPSHYIEDDWNNLLMISQCRCGIELNSRCKCIAVFRIPNEAK